MDPNDFTGGRPLPSTNPEDEEEGEQQAPAPFGPPLPNSYILYPTIPDHASASTLHSHPLTYSDPYYASAYNPNWGMVTQTQQQLFPGVYDMTGTAALNVTSPYPAASALQQSAHGGSNISSSPAQQFYDYSAALALQRQMSNPALSFTDLGYSQQHQYSANMDPFQQINVLTGRPNVGISSPYGEMGGQVQSSSDAISSLIYENPQWLQPGPSSYQEWNSQQPTNAPAVAAGFTSFGQPQHFLFDTNLSGNTLAAQQPQQHLLGTGMGGSGTTTRRVQELTHVANVTEEPMPRKERKKRKRKAKDMPKRPLSAYNLFFRDQRAEILKPVPEESVSILYKGGTMSSKDAPTVKEGEAFHDEDPRESGATDDRARAAEANDYRKGRRPPHHKVSFKDLAQRIGRKWKNISAEELQRYRVLAKQEKARYQEELVAYHQSKSSAPEGKVDASDMDSEGDSDKDEYAKKKSK